ncbi:hypothetical protein K7432_004019 [Basidiobolus ranarum]|uniref:Uncharacterized protein n=1 Tax=Basidiobolus ranarum TaxID=34480 RepID=A0ABR2WYZ1_9FUNG
MLDIDNNSAMKSTLSYIPALLFLAQGIYCSEQRTEVRVKVDVENEIESRERFAGHFSRFLKDTEELVSRFKGEIRSEHERRVRTKHQALRKINSLEEEVKRRWNHVKRHPHGHKYDKWLKDIANIHSRIAKIRKMIQKL